MTLSECIENLGPHGTIMKLKSFVDEQITLSKDINMTPMAECWWKLSKPALLNFEENARTVQAHIAARHAINIRWIFLISSSKEALTPNLLERQFDYANKDVFNCLK